MGSRREILSHVASGVWRVACGGGPTVKMIPVGPANYHKIWQDLLYKSICIDGQRLAGFWYPHISFWRSDRTQTFRNWDLDIRNCVGVRVTGDRWHGLTELKLHTSHGKTI